VDSFLAVIKTVYCIAFCIYFYYDGYSKYTIGTFILSERCEIIIHIIIVAIDFPSTRKLCTITAAMRVCPKLYYYHHDVWPLGNRTVKICNRRISQPFANREWNNTGRWTLLPRRSSWSIVHVDVAQYNIMYFTDCGPYNTTLYEYVHLALVNCIEYFVLSILHCASEFSKNYKSVHKLHCVKITINRVFVK